MRLLVVEDEQSLREDITKNCSIQAMKWMPAAMEKQLQNI